MQSECKRAGCWKENQRETGDTAQVSDPSITIHESYFILFMKVILSPPCHHHLIYQILKRISHLGKDGGFGLLII